MEVQCLRLQTDSAERSVRRTQNVTQPNARKTPYPVLRSGEQSALRCPDVEVSTHSIVPPAGAQQEDGFRGAGDGAGAPAGFVPSFISIAFCCLGDL